MTAYHKGMGMTGQSKVVHRYVPREVGELVGYYVWLVLPFWRPMVQWGTNREADAGSSYLWVPVEKEALPLPKSEGTATAGRKRKRRESGPGGKVQGRRGRARRRLGTSEAKETLDERAGRAAEDDEGGGRRRRTRAEDVGSGHGTRWSGGGRSGGGRTVCQAR
jgi:hypothetical protein